VPPAWAGPATDRQSCANFERGNSAVEFAGLDEDARSRTDRSALMAVVRHAFR
jgi:hypothetical protein